jgi:O-Antigen ligase
VIIWPYVVGFLLVGYFCMTKSFAYLGIPPLQIFVGEIVLATFLLLKPRVVLGTWAASLLRASPLNALGLAMLVFVLYGVWEMMRGAFGSSLFYTLKFFIFNYYALYLFLGIWVGIQAPEFLPKLIRCISWVHGIYGLIWVVALRYAVGYYMPGSDVRLFGQPGGGMVVILGLLCFEGNVRAVWPLLAINIIVTLAMQVRAEWLGLALGMLVWGALTRRIGRVVALGMAGLAVLGMLELAGIQLPGRNRGTELSLGETIGRALAPINLELAREFSPQAGRHASTAEWRELWWEQIWRSVHSRPMLEAFGHGYGFNLFGLAPDEVRVGQEDADVRTPHSVFYYALGYTGWVGVALFAVFQFAILKLLWRSYCVSGQPAGLVFWVMGMSMAFFEESFETPYRAIPFYLLVGMTMAPALQWWGEGDARPARPQLLPAVGR